MILHSIIFISINLWVKSNEISTRFFKRKIQFFAISLLKLKKKFRRYIFETMKNISNDILILKFNLKHNNNKLTLIKAFKTKCHEYVSHWRKLLLLYECDMCIVIIFLVLSRKKVYLFKKLITFVEIINFHNFSSKFASFERIAKVCLNWKNDNKLLFCVNFIKCFSFEKNDYVLATTKKQLKIKKN